MNEQHEGLTRRQVLTGVGGLAAGLAIGGLGVPSAMASAGQDAIWPMPYVKLDPEEVRKLGHRGYYEGECCRGAFSAIVGSLQRKVGPPFTGIPINIMAYGTAGVAGWCTLCGALNGACAAISLVSENYKAIANELLQWYVQTPFPSEKANALAVNHQYLVDKYKSDKALPSSVPGSPLCHINVSRWCKEHGYASGSSERSERCARISGDVAAYAVELLNMDMDGKFAAMHKPSAEVEGCRVCHKKGKDFEAGNWTRGKMECSDCHNEATVKLVGPDHP
jgi:hypothetical protein